MVASPAHGLIAQEMEVPLALQMPIMMKVIGFDRRLRTRAPSEVVVAVIFQSGNRESAVARDEAVRILRELAVSPTAVAGLPLRVVEVDLDAETLADAFREHKFTHAYVTPLRAVDVKLIAAVARSAHVTTMTGVTHYVTRGLAIGVALRGGRPRILVNLEASRLEGADLSSELLNLVEIVP
jgi:hypothetical protein